MPCTERISSICDAGHKQSWKCSDGRPKTCPKCERDAKLAKRRQEQEIEAQKRREIEQQKHLARLDDIDAQIDKERQALEDARLKQERSKAIEQKERDLATLIASRAEGTVPAVPGPSTPAPVEPSTFSPSKNLTTASSTLSRSTDGNDVKTSSSSYNAPLNSSLPPVKAETTSQMPPCSAPPKPFPKLAESPSKKEWLRQKNMDGASNTSIDAIMDMTGLEDVKKKVLNIKAKIDASIRQNASFKQDRFNAVLLGNPGTGG
jgi:hypothetical protein